MSLLKVPRNKNFDDFKQEIDALWPTYIQEASRILRTLTPEGLQGAMVHPDGFLKLSIGPQDGVRDGQVRLHFWIPGRGATWQPHGHPWHLASSALAGTYREYLPVLRLNDSGQLKKFMVIYPPDEDVRAGVHQVGTSTFDNELGTLYETKEGGAHYLPAGPIHMSSPEASGGVTLAIMSPRFRDRAYFFAPDNVPYSEVVNVDDVESIMEIVLAIRNNF